MGDYMLEMTHIEKHFGGVKALTDVTIQVEEGEIHGICGENGAGKSTLMNVLSGVYPFGTYSGDIHYLSEECKFSGIKDSEEKGIVIIHQELALIPQLSIGENIFLGNEVKKGIGIDWDMTHQMAESLLHKVGLNEDPRMLVQELSVGKQQLVEIAKALSKNVKLLILDEPTASLNDEDSNHLLDIILGLRANGMTAIIISHKLAEIERVADHITVIRDGATIETMSAEDGISEQRIIKSMVGRELTNRFPARTSNIGDISLEVKNWNVYHPQLDRKTASDINIKLRKGEVVGLSGLMGAGRSEFAMSVFGKLYGRDITGQLYLGGKEIKLNSVEAAIKHKIAYVTEDRKSCGLVLTNSIRMNTTLANMGRISNHGTIDADQEVNMAEAYSKLLNVKCNSIEDNADSLSGGNQQKVLLAKWMFTEPEVLILDEPTRGIDVGAKYEIYQFINKLVDEGLSILMISSEMPELLGMCDRIYVMSEGRMVAELDKEEATQEAIMTSIIESAGKEQSI
ncbi:MAG: sugar ABC transporter ATP-binding protein [Clostridiales Family XIII bacterium]|nr:sugar ABC transporter ATP-binding protein [Clostridiales Family XIII bacterium]